MDYCKVVLLLVWTIIWQVITVQAEHQFLQRIGFATKLKEFKICLSTRSVHKPKDILDCLKIMKLDSDNYWKHMEKNGFGDLENGDDGLIDIIKQLHYLSNIMGLEMYQHTNWDDIIGQINTDGSSEGSDEGSGEGSGYSIYPDDDYEIDYYDLYGSGDGSDEGSGEGSGYSIYRDDDYEIDYYGYYQESRSSASEGSKQNQRDVLDIKSLMEALKKYSGVTTSNSPAVTDITIDEMPYGQEPDEDPCVSPFLDIAYKICVLPVFDQKLTWDDAQHYCRSRGLKLAIDPAVIKGRKYLHRTLGVDGTRERFPIWIGAKLEESEKRWLFTDGVKVPNFFWSKGNPRTYNPNTTPAGACVYLDGFREYYAASLPCHYKRRFICQKW